ncbi:unnamed protein product, partial [Allacma fusca]
MHTSAKEKMDFTGGEFVARSPCPYSSRMIHEGQIRCREISVHRSKRGSITSDCSDDDVDTNYQFSHLHPLFTGFRISDGISDDNVIPSDYQDEFDRPSLPPEDLHTTASSRARNVEKFRPVPQVFLQEFRNFQETIFKEIQGIQTD